MKMSSHLKAELAATCSTLGRLHKGEYLIEPECIESLKDLIRYLKRDNDAHEIRRYLGESKVLQNDLIHVIKSCPKDNTDLFDVTLRLLINLTTPTMLFYGEEIPAEKIGRNIYLSLVGYSQDYKTAFCDVEFWIKMCGKLTDLFETDWTERSADDGIQIERILMLLRNVLQVPADVESEKRPENDITIHDKVLWALRQSQILELLLFVSSNENEEQYYLNLLEIFSLILREQNPKLLAKCDVKLSALEKNKNTEELIRVRESEKKCRNKYLNMRNFNATFVMKGVKSLSNNDVVCHRSLAKVNEMDFNNLNKKQRKTQKNKIPVESERAERRSTFSVRLFLKEFCLEFLNCAFKHLMHVVKHKLDSGKGLANDETYYFWALKFFLDFATASNLDVDLIKDFLSSESFHFVQTSMDNAFEHLIVDKKKTVDWVKRIHLILKAYRSLLETLFWMDCSKSPLTRSISREIKSQIFYVVEYREMMLHNLLLYDSTKFSVSYLRDLIETTHLFIKLLEEYSKQTKLVVQKITKKKLSRKKSKQVEEVVETREEKWESIKDDVYDILCSENTFPEIPPFDAALDIPIDDQKGRAMINIQKLLHKKEIRDAIGLLRSSRQVWPENDYFGSEGMTVEDETMALQEICCADLGEVEGDDAEKKKSQLEEEDDEENEESEGENRTQIVEKDFDIMDYKKRLVNKKVVEGCGILLKNYKKNSYYTNHCVIKFLYRIGWECCMPAMLFQASIFWTLLKIMRDNSKNYDEINTFTKNLLRRFRKHAEKNPVVFLELLFWKDRNVALEIQHGYEPQEKPKAGKRSKKKKSSKPLSNGEEKIGECTEIFEANDVEINESIENKTKKKRKKRTRKTKNNEKQIMGHSETNFLNLSGNENDLSVFASKNINNASRVLFNDSDTNDDETSALNQSCGRENVAPKSHQDDIQRLNMSAEINESNKILGSPNRVLSKLKNTTNKPRIISSSDEENDGNNLLKDVSFKSLKTANSQSKRGQAFLNISDGESEKENTRKETRVTDVQLCHSVRPSALESDQQSPECVIEKGPEDISQGNDSDRSQTSSASSKKRKRKNRKEGTGMSADDSEDSDISKWKRVRYIGSDSDLENHGTEAAIFVKKGRRRKLAVIDSDSDMESRSSDEK